MLITLIVVLALLAGGVIGGVVIITRLETGEWKVPTRAEIVRIVKRAPREPARIIFLERGPIEIRPGTDDSRGAISSVLANIRSETPAHRHDGQAAAPSDHDDGPASAAPAVKVSVAPASMPGWKGSAASWQKVMACVRNLYEPFNVTVTDQRPSAKDDYVLAVVGGRPADLGVTDRKVGGLAPFHGGVIARPVVFAFAAQLDHDVRSVCDAVGMEIAHAYGLDHAYLCNDVMTYLRPCGTKKFVDKDARCGENEPRNCEGGEPTQNSYRRLLQVLGPRLPAPKPPAKAAPKPPAKAAPKPPAKAAPKPSTKQPSK